MNGARHLRTVWAMLAFATLSGGESAAHEIRHGDLAIAHPFVSYDRACNKGSTKAYLMLVVNTSKQSDRLTGASLDGSGKGVLWRTSGEGGKTALPTGIEIPPSASISVMPPNYVIEFPRTRQVLVEGGMVAGTLTFLRAGPVPVQFMVDAAHSDTDPNSACKSAGAPAPRH